MKRARLAILLAEAVKEAVRPLRVDLDALRKRLSRVNAGIEIAELRAAATASPEDGVTIH
jgi:hypothetical protein